MRVRDVTRWADVGLPPPGAGALRPKRVEPVGEGGPRLERVKPVGAGALRPKRVEPVGEGGPRLKPHPCSGEAFYAVPHGALKEFGTWSM
ncbi:hypothetical protein GCM10023195_38410 [Actinoallomurus liliacearum]|uniref:Uncharacterized protein n=1 Tax=Actinoallomurus liliacearum TaxID=1080073 RepID=A0ABP8TJ62_9ACTN